MQERVSSLLPFIIGFSTQELFCLLPKLAVKLKGEIRDVLQLHVKKYMSTWM